MNNEAVQSMPIKTQEVQQEIRLSIGTKAICTQCGDEYAPTLYLKRARGKYDLLCVNLNGSGCYPQSCRTLCRYVDPERVQCTQLAEWEITYGADKLRSTQTCSDHVGRMLSDSNSHSIHPLED
jgi:hypothetical protein